jgi:ABC-2 type transport system permease protein
LRSHEPKGPAPLAPLLANELREIVGGRALWIMLLLVCPLIGYSFFQAISLYGESSAAGLQSPVLASSLSPFDGILVPTFGAFYVAVTLLFPFVAIRAVSHEKESGALRLLVQLPYHASTLIGAKFVAVLGAWLLAGIPVLSTLVIWMMLGGHLSPAETLNLFAGHLLYGSLVGAIALFSAAIAESAASAAVITLAFTIGSWVLDFTVAGRPGLAEWIARLSLTQTLRTFEQGMLSVAVALGMGVVICGFAALAGAWLAPGTPLRSKLARSAAIGLAAVIAVIAVSRLNLSVDVTEDRRNSFPAADQRLLARLGDPLTVTVHMAPEDPRYADLQRNVLAKLERAMPHVTILLGGDRQSDERYGEVEYVYGDRQDVSRSTSSREILPLLYSLAGVAPPAPDAARDYPGLSPGRQRIRDTPVVFRRAPGVDCSCLVVEPSSAIDKSYARS